jgi:hypothetical protein
MGSIYIFGETHGFADDLKYQEEILKEIHPEYFLYEMLEDVLLINNLQIKGFLQKKDSESFSVISLYGELKPTIRIAGRLNIKIIGCDIKNMGRKDDTFLLKKRLSPKEKIFEQDLLKRREKHQAETILKYSHISEKPLFVSVGAYHLRKNSLLLKSLTKSLKKEKVTIYLPFYNGRSVSGPKEGMDPKKIVFKKVSLSSHLR